MPIDIITQHTSIPVKIGVEKMKNGTILREAIEDGETTGDNQLGASSPAP